MYTSYDILNKYKARLNKSDSADYDNLWNYQVEETYNKGKLEVIRRLKRGKNPTQEGDEETRDRVDDLQILIKEKLLSVGQSPIHVDTALFPEDYLYFKRITPFATRGNCKRRRLKCYQREESNVDVLLSDWDSQPSFDFEETFHTILGNKARVFHNKDFRIEEALLTYYKKPRYIEIKRGVPVELEFKEDLEELFMDEGIKIMAGDLELQSAMVLAEKRIENNN